MSIKVKRGRKLDLRRSNPDSYLHEIIRQNEALLVAERLKIPLLSFLVKNDVRLASGSKTLVNLSRLAK